MKESTEKVGGILRTAGPGWVRALSATLVVMLAAAAVHAQERVVIVHGSLGAYVRVAKSIEAHLVDAGHHTRTVQLDKKESPDTTRRKFDDAQAYGAALVITVGAAATERMRQFNAGTRMLFSMVPNVLDADFHQSLAGISCDPSPDDQVRWVRETAPACRSVAVLYSAATRQTADALQKAGRNAGLRVDIIEAARDRFPDALDAIEQADAGGVLMLLDPKIYNAANIRALLVWGGRNRKPIWSFSGNIVKAGAFAAQFYDPEEIARQTAERAQQMLKGDDTEMLEYARRLDRAVNLHTSEIIGRDVNVESLRPRPKIYGVDP